jgi:hypothetical protein
MNQYFDLADKTGLWEEVSLVTAWSEAIIHPGKSTYEKIGKASNAKGITGMLWYYVALAVGMILSLSLYSIIGFPSLGNFFELFIVNPSHEPLYTFHSPQELIQTIILVPFVSIVPALLYTSGIFIVNLIANGFRGKESFASYLFVDSAVSAPLFVVRSILMTIPRIGLVFFLLVNFYRVILRVVVLHRVKKVSWGVAMAIVLIPAIFMSIAIPVLIYIGIQIMLSQAIPVYL